MGRQIVSLVGRYKDAPDHTQKENERDSSETNLNRKAVLSRTMASPEPLLFSQSQERVVTLVPSITVANHTNTPVSTVAQQPSDTGAEHDTAPTVAAALEPLRHTFRDAASSRATTARALHLLDCSGLDAPEFMRHVQEAAERTRGSLQIGSITGNPMAYFFACLVQLLGGTARPRVERHLARTGSSESPREEYGAVPETDLPDGSHPVWRQVQQELATTLVAGSYQEMVASTSVVGEEEHVLRVAVRSVFQRNWLDNRLGKRITDILSDMGREGLRVEFVLPGAGIG